MTLGELDDLVSRWLRYGLPDLTEQEQQACKQYYLMLLGHPPTCTSCPDFWADCLHALRVHLKQSGYQRPPTTASMKKYILLRGPFFVLYRNIHVVDYQVDQPGFRELTDELGDELAASRPEYLGVFFALNPDYVLIEATAEHPIETQTVIAGDELFSTQESPTIPPITQKKKRKYRS